MDRVRCRTQVVPRRQSAAESAVEAGAAGAGGRVCRIDEIPEEWEYAHYWQAAHHGTLVHA